MAKTQDIPISSMRGFNKSFEKLCYKHNPSDVFRDFLDLTIKQFSFDDASSLNSRIQERYDQNERYVFGEMIKQYFLSMNEELIKGKQWFDFLGTYYEIIASQYKRSSFGQFFTPPTVCDFIAQINSNEKECQLVADPACGSGRMLIAHHVINLGNFYEASDLDMICTKMTILNFCLHGVVGIVTNSDTIKYEHYRMWVVNEKLTQTGIPTIREITEKEMYAIQRLWKFQVSRNYNKHEEKLHKIFEALERLEKSEKPILIEKITKPKQLELFA